MRFTIAREKLQEALASVAAVVPSKTTLPVLANILLEARDGSVRLSGTDLDVAVSVSVPAEVESNGAATVPAKRLSEIVRELAPAPVQMAALSEQRVTLKCGKTEFKLLGMPRDEFPALPPVDYGAGWRVKAAILHELIARSSFAVSTEESRPILNGVLWEVKPEHMRMVATNGHRLALMEVASGDGANSISGSFIVPPRALDFVRRVFPPEEEVEIGRGETYLAFRSPLASVSTRLIEGPYPNYDQVIPRDNDREAILDRAKRDTPALAEVELRLPNITFQREMHLHLGHRHLQLLHTPGHTRGGISLLTDKVVFVGDTLFQGSIGRTDFPGGDYETLISSVREKLFPLGDDVQVLSGHGPVTTIGRERRFNPFF